MNEELDLVKIIILAFCLFFIGALHLANYRLHKAQKNLIQCTQLVIDKGYGGTYQLSQ